jgi:hypothetical protein
MTREKKEIIKEINWRCEMLCADDAMGGGFTPFNKAESNKIQELEDRLARLQGFEDADAKTQWQMENLPISVQAVVFEW